MKSLLQKISTKPETHDFKKKQQGHQDTKFQCSKEE